MMRCKWCTIQILAGLLLTISIVSHIGLDRLLDKGFFQINYTTDPPDQTENPDFETEKLAKIQSLYVGSKSTSGRAEIQLGPARKSQMIREECGNVQVKKIDYTFTWVDPTHKIGFSLPPKCASTTLRLIQMVKVGFISRV